MSGPGMMLPMAGTQESNSTPAASPLRIASLALGIAALILAVTLPAYNVGWAVAVAAAAVIVGITSRGAGVWLARVGVIAGLIAGVIGLWMLSV